VGGNAPDIILRFTGTGKALGGGGQGSGGNGAATVGGDAIYCQVNMAIQNSGEIKGGGGGGGAGDADEGSGPAENWSYPGGAGGGGAPNGAGGTPIEGFYSFDPPGTEDDLSYPVYGNPGSPGTLAGGGAGGAAGEGTSTAGSAGGSYGAAGTLGAAGGYAVRKNGYTVTITGSGSTTGTVG
jgi:hypothetical protein